MGSVSAIPEINLLVIGAGQRGTAYAAAIHEHRHSPGEAHIPGNIVSVVEPNAWKRCTFGRKYIWGAAGRKVPAAGEAWPTWQSWVEHARRHGRGGVDAVAICVLDEMHVEILEAVQDLGVHVLCEKPLVTRRGDIRRVWDAYRERTELVVGVCHVLRYSPHNILLRELVRDKRLVGDVVSVEHTEPVGWWHFSHSYVRLVVPFLGGWGCWLPCFALWCFA